MVNDIIDRYGVENVRAALERHTGNKLPTGGYLQQYNAANHNLPPTKVPWDSAYVQESIRANRQRYAESAFKDAAKSPAGAVGAWQIMPITKRDYLTRGKGKDGNLLNPKYNRQVRDFALNMVPRDLGDTWSDDADSTVNEVKRYIGYNWGAGNLKRHLKKAAARGIDIHNSLDWITGVPKESEDYADFIVLQKDVPGTSKTLEAYRKAWNTRMSDPFPEDTLSLPVQDWSFRTGGKIHIKPENRGKFTALKKRTGHSASWFKAHGTPAQKKMAVFALNARKWKHADGGLLHLYDGLSSPTGKLWRIGETEYEIPTAEQPMVQIPMRDKQTIMLQEAPVVQVRPEERILTKPVESTPQDYGDTLGDIRSALQQQGTLQAEAKPLEELDLSIPAVTIPSRDSNAFFRGAAERELQKAYEFDPTGKSREEIRETQARLADEGYFASQLAGKSKDEIKAIQHKLIQKGLLSSAKNADGTYKEMDGIVGDKTTAAYNKYNVDGLWGNRSKDAYNKYIGATQGNSTGLSADFSTDGIDGCAKWVTRKYESALGGISRQNGVYGNAWQMPMNIGKSGGDVLFNLYEKGFEDVKTPAELVKRTRERLKEDSFDISRLQPGDVVGIFYPGSTHHSDVLEEGTTYNTHVGIVTGYDKDGYPIVEHNVGGHHHKNRADKISLGTITTVSRPKNTGQIGEYPFAMGESKYEVSLPERYSKNEKLEQSEKLKTFMDSMAGAAAPIGNIYKNADMDAVQRIATAVLGRETGFMQNTESSRTGKAGRRVRREQLLRSIISPIEPERKSSDLTKFKLSTLSPDERSFLGIKEPKDLENPEKAARASLLTLAKNYDYFVRYANENPQLGLTKQDIEDLTALSYNQGMGRLYTVGTADFNGERRVAPSKLELIRQAAASDEVINDFNATKLGRIATEFPALTGLMRQMFDAGAGTRSTSYMNAARKALENVRAKNSE